MQHIVFAAVSDFATWSHMRNFVCQNSALKTILQHVAATECHGLASESFSRFRSDESLVQSELRVVVSLLVLLQVVDVVTEYNL